ncbi:MULTISPECIES: galactose oxidase early set domain-containing protein [unclassified Streptomyces]|uniref:galactose oxidase early set domain-containing protein n=1 Tax=unclassified Streptomyces TaxID=2593676 RepID=UPI002257D699|nr:MULTISPECIES: galactose oxidase early set domain-containing protein [unclassified Streptomyces]MCX4988784.1 galactose oxidase early set domain-containing protein [Streptomyces sp. NBC_00568]MCX5005994.1 galactose oxidase early set domain-containing protein [Streptomyces sp. NBC_00638]
MAVTGLAAGLLLVSPQPASAVNLITNPGFETGGTDGMPSCWEKSGWGDNDFSFATVTDAHSGSKAMKVTLTRRVDGDRKALITESAACAPVVTVGKQYDLGLYYKTTTPDAAITLFRHDTTAGWQYWTDLKTLDMAAAWTQATVRTPAVPAGTDRITWGVSVYGTGSATTDDYTMEQVADPVPPATCTGTAEECANGKWTVLPTQNPVRSMHSVVLKNGKVLLIAGSGNSEENFDAGTFTSAVYNPATGSYKVIPTPKDMFCAGHVQLADGRVLVMSGNKAFPVAGGHGYEGYKDSYIFDPVTETYSKTNDLNDGHWYPSATELGNGDIISFGGLREDSSGSVTAERWSNAQQQWLPLWQVNQTWSFWGLYPSMILMQDGRLFYSGSHVFGNGTPGTGSAIYDYDANTTTAVPGLQNKDERDQSASVLLPPAQDQKVLTIGGGNIDSNPAANRLTDIIDLKAANPAYTVGPQIPQGTVDLGNGKVAQTGAQGKMYVSAVLLPDGKVLETGGGLHNRADPVYEASIFDPATSTFDPVTADPQARGYHSSAFLLPDGRVMATGDNPGNGTWNHNVSIYTPPYLLKGTRPTITSVIDNEWVYGDTQRITVDRPIVKAELIRPAAVTHSSDPNQRFVDLPLSVDGNNVDLNVTSNPNMAPPGWYMLFAVDANGVPSVAKWVHLQGPSALAGDTASAHVHSFADSLEGTVTEPGKKRASQKVSTTISGCDRHYGTINVCVPTVFPDGVKKTTASRCAWLKKNDYGRLRINGKDDPLGLDPSKDGLACGKKDLIKR